MDQLGFELLDEDAINELLNGVDSENTKKAIIFAVRRFEEFEKVVGEQAPVAVDQLDIFLKRFYSCLRQKNGDLYQKKSMQAIRYGLQRHFLQLRNFDIVEGPEFTQSNKMWKAVLVKLKKCGKGSVKHKAAISLGDMDKLQQSADLNIDTPKGLQNKVFIDLMLYFGNRGRENLRDMSPVDYFLDEDEDGLSYISRRDMMTKARREGDDESYSGVMYEIAGSERCPVTTYLEYVSKLNPKLSGILWQKPRKMEDARDGSLWYDAVPVGKNTLGNKMKVLAESAGLSKPYTNHSLRATCVTVLDTAGFASRDIMSVSGHKSETSLKHYVQTSDDKKKRMSAAIAKQIKQERAMPNPRPSPTTSIPRPKPENIPGPSNATADVVQSINLNDQQQLALVEGGSALLTSSQEQVILQEMSMTSMTSTTNVSNSPSIIGSTIQNFNFHGSVTFYNHPNN